MIQQMKLFTIGASLSMLVGCTAGRNLKTPEVPRGASLLPAAALPALGAELATTQNSDRQYISEGLDIPGQWWELFHSDELNGLIRSALERNPTLAAAQAALRRANENVAAQRGSLFPDVAVAYQSERQQAFGGPRSENNLYSLNTASVTVSYTLDLFGASRRQVEVLQAQADYQRFALEASYLSLTSNVVIAAITEASLRAQLRATEDIAESQRAQLGITQLRVAAGDGTRADILQQQATYQATLASIPALRARLEQQRNQLAIYTGSLPADYSGSDFYLESLKLPQTLPLSLPSRFIEQRPDLREYDALLHQATAQIGVATANLLPQIVLTGNYGGEAVRFADIFSPASAIWTIASSIAQPLFDGGQLLHQRRASLAAAAEAAANYKATVLTAFQNVGDTLYALDADTQTLAAEVTAEATAAANLQLVQAQYDAGATSYLQVLTAEQTYQTAAIDLVKAQSQRYVDTAALFQALGGGWWNRADVDEN